MKKKFVPILGATLAAGLGLTMGQTAVATPTQHQNQGVPSVSGEPRPVAQDELPNPLEDKRRALREEAVSQVLNGEATPQKRGKSTVVKLGGEFGRGARDKGRKPAEYVEVARQSTDRVFVVLAEFGNERHPSYPDQDTDPDTPGPTRFDGPLRNQIPQPDRSKDNSTVWQPDYNRAHFQETYFGDGKNAESLKTYYEKQSSGRFSVSGTVTDWVKVRYNEARYGRSDGFPCDSQRVLQHLAAPPGRRQPVVQRPDRCRPHA